MTQNQSRNIISKESAEKIKKLYSDLQTLLVMLYERWLDESEYEDIKDYSVNIVPMVSDVGAKFVKMNKRPFGFDFVLEGHLYRFYVNSRFYGYKHLKQMNG